MKKLLLATLTTLSFITVPAAAGERPDQVQSSGNIYNPNDYRVEFTAESPLPLLIPDYFKQVYKDNNNPLEKYKPLYFCDKLFPVCIYRYYYYDDNYNKIFIEIGPDIYNINGKDYISIR